MSDNRIFFQDTATRLFTDACRQQTVEQAETREFPEALWDELGNAGVTHMLLPDSAGGVGASVAEAGAILSVAGAFAAPGPIVETMVANLLLARAGLPPRTGPVALAFAADAEVSILQNIAWAERAEALVVVVQAERETILMHASPSDWTIEPGRDIAGEPSDTLSACGVLKATVALDDTAYGEAFRTAALLRACQIAGALEWVVERTVAYATERRQFGREIGKFQVVQQQLADMAGSVAAGIAMTDAAAEAGAEAAAQGLVAAARARLGDSIDTAVQISHQVHGAIGFSREYALNFRTRRLMKWRDDFGTTAEWRRRLAGSFIGLSANAVWPAIDGLGGGAAP